MTEQELIELLSGIENNEVVTNHWVPEFRVYYDKNGAILFYSMENLPGNYLVITSEQYAASRYDYVVRNGKLINSKRIFHKMKKTPDGVVSCKYDISIIPSKDDTDIVKWSQVSNEID